MGFTVPGVGVPDPLPQDITAAIERSVANFEQKFNGFGMLTMARASGWIEEYRRELQAIARLARGKK